MLGKSLRMARLIHGLAHGEIHIKECLAKLEEIENKLHLELLSNY